jgi:cation diffusion facilitator family transporter
MTVEKDQIKQVRDVFLITLVLNIVVAMSKLIYGLITSSLSMQADGFHSTLDSASNVLGIAALTVAAKPADEDHPYGHHKFEAMGAIAISFLMFLASFQVLREAANRLSGAQTIPEATAASYFIMVGTMIINFGVSKYEHRKSVELNNSLLAADAKHTASDIFVSLTVIITLVASQLRIPMLDLLGSVVIVFIILRAGYGIITAQLGYLLDQVVVDPKAVEQMVMSVDGVRGCHKIRSRGSMEQIFIDLHIQVDEQLSVKEGHVIASTVEQTLKTQFGGNVDVLVHIEEQQVSEPV